MSELARAEWENDEIVTATDEEACSFALRSVQAFLHGEMPEAAADEIREHLMLCESCLDNFNVEQMISTMVKRCSETPCASSSLRGRISALTVRYQAN